ncbi:AI-2E family transporter [Clostridium oryzae]|uniref:Pheromone autoinducer 2 transporter n=1 Tax=Clostridium oryzae TaxID=1450648 RepID=A0A1V4IIZ0_9CLOT|nr:pheromone autoinducer 2 transporter [Clostridium oryzae]
MLKIVKESFNKNLIKRIIEFAVLGLLVYLMRDLFNLFFLTFLFSYLIYNMQKFLVDKTHIPRVIVILLLYVVIVGFIVFFIYRYVPELIKQFRIMLWEISKVKVPDEFAKYINPIIEKFDISKYSEKYMGTIVEVGKNVAQLSLNIFLAIILSMFFVLENEKIRKLLAKFRKSKIAGVYSYFEYFGVNFLNSFGKVIQAQILIAFVNSILSIIVLWILGFPQLIGLGFMIFVLSFIPVAGVVISLVPLSLIAFSIGGPIKVVYVLIMIVLLHCLESYVLNPKLMADKTKLPMFFTFILLILGEHFMGIWGLLLSIPLFIFFLDIINVKVQD